MVRVSKNVREYFGLILLILAVPILASLLSGFLRINFQEAFECWCRQDGPSSLTSSKSTQSVATYPSDFVTFVSPANLTAVTNTTNLPLVATDSSGVQYLSFLSASSQYLALKPISLTVTTGFTVIARIVFTGAAATWERILDFGTGPGTTGLVLARSGNSTDMVSQLWNGGNASPYATFSNGIAQNKLMNVAFTYDPSVGGGTSSIYLNGALATSASAQSAFASTSTPSNVFVGRSEWSADSYANINLYRLAMYNRVLSSAEISSSATSPM